MDDDDYEFPEDNYSDEEEKKQEEPPTSAAAAVVLKQSISTKNDKSESEAFKEYSVD